MSSVKSFFADKIEAIGDFSEDEEFMRHFSWFKEELANQGEDALLMIVFVLILKEIADGEVLEEYDLVSRVSFLENDLKKIKKMMKRLKS